MLFRMQILRKSSFTAVPWKNGGGITHEALRVPLAGDTFRWRVSVAQIDVSGPFSNFAGYQRRMVLLRGSGVRLTFDGSQQKDLLAVGDLAEFDGGVATDCELLDGPCTDLNLMVSDSVPGWRAEVERLLEPRALQSIQETLLVFPVTGPVSLDYQNGEATMLNEWDLAVLMPGDGAVLGAAATGSPLVFLATLNDNSL
jgi:environmental stress-induced protein Ves